MGAHIYAARIQLAPVARAIGFGAPGEVLSIVQFILRRLVVLVVVGAGGAGLRAAIEASQGGASVGLICKSLLGKAHTVMAEGGVAAALANVDLARVEAEAVDLETVERFVGDPGIDGVAARLLPGLRERQAAHHVAAADLAFDQRGRQALQVPQRLRASRHDDRRLRQWRPQVQIPVGAQLRLRPIDGSKKDL